MVKEIPLTHGCVALVDDEDYERVNQYKWCVTNSKTLPREKWYAKRCEGNRTYFMHRFILDIKKGEMVDHINGNGLDNRRCNLRIINNSQNSMNRRKTLGISKYKGVSWDKINNKWVSHISFNYKCINLGRYINEEDAARAYDKAAKKYFGEYACINFPKS